MSLPAPILNAALVAASAALLAACPASHPAGRWDCTGNPCDDGEACNGAETCDPEAGCAAGVVMDCDDGDPCTVDGCAAGACSHSPRDLDADGYADPCAGGDDCAPEDPAIHPGADEACNGVDDDCDGDVDEGLSIEPVETITTTLVSSTGLTWPPMAILDDRTLVFVHGPEIAALHDGELSQDDLGEPPAPWFIHTADPGDGALVTSDGLHLAEPGGPALTSITGESGHRFDAVDLWLLQWNGGLEVNRLRRVGPEDDERASPASLDVDSIGGAPFAIWTDAHIGRSRVLLVPFREAQSAPIVVAEGRGVVRSVRLAGRPDGGVVVWTEGEPDGSWTVWAAELEADAQPTGHVVAVRHGQPMTIDACALADETIVAIGAGSDDVTQALELVVLGPTLGGPRTLVRFQGEGETRVRCEGHTVTTVQDDRIRRILRDGSVDADVPLPADVEPALVAGSGIWRRTGDWQAGEALELTRWGCSP